MIIIQSIYKFCQAPDFDSFVVKLNHCLKSQYLLKTYYDPKP